MNCIIKGCKDNPEMNSQQSHMKTAKMNSITSQKLKNKLEMRRFLIQEDFLRILSECKHRAFCWGWGHPLPGESSLNFITLVIPGSIHTSGGAHPAPLYLSHVLVSSSHNILIKFGLVFLAHLTLCIKGEALHMPPGWGPCNSSFPEAGCFARQGERQLNQSRGNCSVLGR